jgi:hypothetical protein
MPATLTRNRFREYHRIARLGILGTLACRMEPAPYQWFLREVYDLRFPRIGDERHNFPRTFCSLRGRMVRRGKTLVRVRY